MNHHPNSICSVFKSRQRDYFCNLMRRVCSRQEVQDVKENILIHKVEKIKGRVVPVRIYSILGMEKNLQIKLKNRVHQKVGIKIKNIWNKNNSEKIFYE